MKEPPPFFASGCNHYVEQFLNCACYSWLVQSLPRIYYGESPSGKDSLGDMNEAFHCIEEIPVFRFAPTGIRGRSHGEKLAGWEYERENRIFHFDTTFEYLYPHSYFV